MNDKPAKPPPIEITLEIDAPVTRVWTALTDPGEIAAWFADRVDGLEPQEGSEGYFVWDGHGRYAVIIEALEPERKLVWRWARKPGTALEGAYSTVVEWRISATPDSDRSGTRLSLVESGFRTAKDREENVAGWDHELSELVERFAR